MSRKSFGEGLFGTSGDFVNTVSKFEDKNTISKDVYNQGIEKDYDVLYKV